MSACPECGRDCTCEPKESVGISTHWAYANQAGMCNFCDRQYDRDDMRVKETARVLVMHGNHVESRICADCILQGIAPFITPKPPSVTPTIPARRPVYGKPKRGGWVGIIRD